MLVAIKSFEKTNCFVHLDRHVLLASSQELMQFPNYLLWYSTRGYLPWILTALLACACLFTTSMWLRDRRALNSIHNDPDNYFEESLSSYENTVNRKNFSPGVKPKSHEGISLTKQPSNLRAALKHLQDCCKQSNPLEIKHALLAWSQLLFKSTEITNLRQIKQISGDQNLLVAIEKLEAALYSNDSKKTEFDASELLKAATEVQNNSKSLTMKNAANHNLPPLYKN